MRPQDMESWGYLVINMHINLNNTGEHFLQLSPLFGRADQRPPSPMLSPEPLFLTPPISQDMMQFGLEEDQDEELSGIIQLPIDNLSPPLPYPSNIGQMDDSQSQLIKMEDPQPIVRKRKESKLARTAVPLAEDLPPLKLPNSQLPPVRAVIEFLVENTTQPEGQLMDKGSTLWGEGQALEQILANLIGKFKKLRKTKQQMTKYCMRKVFKFIADRMRKDRTHNRDVDSCMKLYFSKSEAGNAFSIPFKKNSAEKTMNGNFLKRVFASQAFVADYRDFLREFQSLMMEDNEKKIIYLADVLDKHIRSSDLKKIESIKRLPWTREILQQTEQLAISLLAFTDDRREYIRDQ